MRDAWRFVWEIGVPGLWLPGGGLCRLLPRSIMKRTNGSLAPRTGVRVRERVVGARDHAAEASGRSQHDRHNPERVPPRSGPISLRSETWTPLSRCWHASGFSSPSPAKEMEWWISKDGRARPPRVSWTDDRQRCQTVRARGLAPLGRLAARGLCDGETSRRHTSAGLPRCTGVT